MVIAAVHLLGRPPEAESQAAARQASGTVTAVTEQSRTLVVEVPLGGKRMIVGVEVPESAAIIVKGKSGRLGDIRVGDRLTLRYIREEHRLVTKRIEVSGQRGR